MNKKAFTLIELLVVIAIIALLAAILFPVFAAAREKARQATCQSNEKQIGLAMLQYVQDYDEQFPFETNAGINIDWTSEIQPYTSVNVTQSGAPPLYFACPDDAVKRPAGYSTRSYAISTDLVNQSSIWIPNPSLPYGGYNLYAGYKLNALSSPAGSIAFAEEPSQANFLGNINGSTVYCPGNTGTAYTEFVGQLSGEAVANSGAPAAPLHSAQWNYVFADGHVKTLHPEVTIGAGGGCTMTAPCANSMWSQNPS